MSDKDIGLSAVLFRASEALPIAGQSASGQPSHAPVAERGVQKREHDLEEPVGDYDGEEKACCVGFVYVPEGDEVEKDCVEELACDG